jgi:flagellar protein FliS
MKYSDANYEQIKRIAEEFPSTLVVMLYDDALENLDIAIGAIEAEDIEERFRASERVADILYNLCISLDLENGGQVSENLAALYKHGIQQMTDINFSNDPAVAESLKRVLEPLRDSWAELDDRIRAEVAEAEAMFTPAYVADASKRSHLKPVTF